MLKKKMKNSNKNLLNKAILIFLKIIFSNQIQNRFTLAPSVEMLSAKNLRKSQCKEAEQLYTQLKTGDGDGFDAFAKKYSKFAVKRLLFYHFGTKEH